MKVRLIGCDRDTVQAVRTAAARRGLEPEVAGDGDGSEPVHAGSPPAVVVLSHEMLVDSVRRDAVAAADDHVIVAAPVEVLGRVEHWLTAGLVDDVITIPTDAEAVAVRLMTAAHAMANRSTRRELAQLRTLRSIEHALAAARSPEEVAHTALELLRKPVGFTRGSVQLFDFENDRATVLAAADENGPTSVGGATDLTTFGISFELLQGQPLVISQLGSGEAVHDGVAAELAAAGFGACAHLPLVGRDTLIGSLLLATRDPHGLGDGQLAIAEEVSRALAISIHDSNLLAAVERMAVTDALTGLLTRGQLFELGRYEIQRARRYGRCLAAAMIDIDHFKTVNDRHGHRVGDVVLAAVADRCRTRVRDVDLVGRYGGEEFALLLPETDLAGALLVAERVRRDIAESAIDGIGVALTVTVSIGVTTLAAGDGDLEALLARADKALYEAKESGRNRSVAKSP